MITHENLLRRSHELTNYSREHLEGYPKDKAVTDKVMRSAQERLFSSRKALCGNSDRKLAPFFWFKPTD